MEWLQPDEFKRRFDYSYRHRRVYIEPQINTDITLNELEEAIPAAPEIYAGGLEEPGPCKRWYGYTGDLLFAVVYYLENTCDVAIILTRSAESPQEQYPWLLLKELVELPSAMLHRVSWIRGHSTNPKVSVYCKNRNEIVSEVYRASSDAEAMKLLSFLKTVGSEYRYFLGKPENLDATWIIVKNQSDRSEIVGRYTVRSDTESLAKKMSTKDNATYLVQEESIDKPAAAFLRGARIPLL